MLRHVKKIHALATIVQKPFQIIPKRCQSTDKLLKEEGFAGRPLYLDAQATTPLDPRVLDEMLPYMTSYYGNPHSRTHSYGWETEKAVEKAREEVANLIGADPKEIVFTSGATESNNISVKGVARFYGSKKKHIITTQTEHKCVLDSCRAMEGEGFSVTYLPVGQNGLISMEELEKAITPNTSLVSIMSVNNEIGVTQPLEDIGKLCREKKVFFHTDAAQAVGKIHLDVQKMNIDLMSISGHKIYGPKGVGALYVRRRPRVRIEALQSGGGQERGIRSGTVPAPLAVGLGAACRIALTEMDYDHKWMEKLSKRLMDTIYAKLTHVIRNGDPVHSYPGCINLSFAYVEGVLLDSLPTIHVLIHGHKGRVLCISCFGYFCGCYFIPEIKDELRDQVAAYLSYKSLAFILLVKMCIGESLLMALKDIALSSGSACTSASLEPSYVLRAIGADEDLAHSSIRFGIGRFTTMEEIDYTAEKCIQHVTRLREMSPLWEMVQEGVDLKSIQWSQH